MASAAPVPPARGRAASASGLVAPEELSDLMDRAEARDATAMVALGDTFWQRALAAADTEGGSETSEASIRRALVWYEKAANAGGDGGSGCVGAAQCLSALSGGMASVVPGAWSPFEGLRARRSPPPPPPAVCSRRRARGPAHRSLRSAPPPPTPFAPRDKNRLSRV